MKVTKRNQGLLAAGVAGFLACALPAAIVLTAGWACLLAVAATLAGCFLVAALLAWVTVTLSDSSEEGDE